MNRKNSSNGDLPKLSAPAQRALDSVGVHRLDQLTRFNEGEIKQLHGLGPTTIVALRRALKSRNLSFRNEKKTS